MQNPANVEKLARMFKVTERMVQYALAGERTGDLSQRIRIAAIQLEPIENTYDNGNEYVISWNEGAVQLKYRRNENDTQIIVNGEPQEEPRIVDCPVFNKMRMQCERIAVNI